MFAINRTTMRDSYRDEDRIGDLEVKDDYLEFQLEVENFIESHLKKNRIQIEAFFANTENSLSDISSKIVKNINKDDNKKDK